MTTTTASGMAPLGAYLAASLDALFHLTVVAAGRSGEGDNQHHLDDSPPADASLDAFSVPLKLPSTLPERVADDDPSADTLLLAASTAIASAPFFSLSSATLLTIAASYSVAIPDRLFDARGTRIGPVSDVTVKRLHQLLPYRDATDQPTKILIIDPIFNTAHATLLVMDEGVPEFTPDPPHTIHLPPGGDPAAADLATALALLPSDGARLSVHLLPGGDTGAWAAAAAATEGAVFTAETPRSLAALGLRRSTMVARMRTPRVVALQGPAPFARFALAVRIEVGEGAQQPAAGERPEAVVVVRRGAPLPCTGTARLAVPALELGGSGVTARAVLGAATTSDAGADVWVELAAVELVSRGGSGGDDDVEVRVDVLPGEDGGDSRVEFAVSEPSLAAAVEVDAHEALIEKRLVEASVVGGDDGHL